MGRRTFNIGEEPWGDNPPFQVPCFVLSEDAREKVVKGATKNVGLMGANTAQQYIKAGLLDEIQIHLVPVLLGEGIQLFEHLGTEQIELERTRVIESFSIIYLRFRVVK